MSKLTDQLQATLGIFNPHDFARVAKQLGGTGVYVDYRTRERGRVTRPAAWQVIDIATRTDPGGHWTDNGHKTFPVYIFGADKAEQRVAAIQWATEYAHAEDWVAGPYPGTFVPKADRALVLAGLRKQLKKAAV